MTKNDVAATRDALRKALIARREAISGLPEYAEEVKLLWQLDAKLMFPPGMFSPDGVKGEEVKLEENEAFPFK